MQHDSVGNWVGPVLQANSSTHGMTLPVAASTSLVRLVFTGGYVGIRAWVFQEFHHVLMK